MAIRDSWRRAMVLSGLVDDNPKGDPDFLSRLMPDAPDTDHGADAPQPTVPPNWQPLAADTPAYPAPATQPDPISARRLDAAPPPPPPSPATPSLFAPPAPRPQATAIPSYTPPPAPPQPEPRPVPPFSAISPPPGPAREVSVHRVAPRSFNDAQLVADQFKRGTPVILDMQGVESDLAKRLIGFASGLTYGLDGGMERLDGRVFLLIPPRVEIPDAQRVRLAAQGSLART